MTEAQQEGLAKADAPFHAGLAVLPRARLRPESPAGSRAQPHVGPIAKAVGGYVPWPRCIARPIQGKTSCEQSKARPDAIGCQLWIDRRISALVRGKIPGCSESRCVDGADSFELCSLTPRTIAGLRFIVWEKV